MKLSSKSKCYTLTQFVSLSLFAQCVFGCGSGPSDPSFSGAYSNQVTQQRSLHGQVLLARAVPGAEISVSLPGGGSPLATTTADQFGDFSFENLTLPENFTVSAKIGGTVLATEVRDFSGTSRYVVINVPTSLTSLYMRQNGASLPEAEGRIRRVLGIADDRSLEYGCHESVREPFSHVAFFSVAARHGGPTALGQSLVRYASTSVPRPLKFRLTRRSAARRFDTEPAIKQVLTSFLAEPFIRHSFTSTGSRAFPNYASVLAGRRVNLSLVESDNENFIQEAEDDIVEVGEELLQDAAKCGPADDVVPAVESLESELTGTLSNVSGATVNILEEGEKDLGAVGVTQLVAIGWTQIASCLNLNYGTSVMLANIQEQLGEVATELTDLDLKATEYELLTLQSNISNSVESIKTLFATYQSNCDPTVVANPQTPYDSATDSKGTFPAITAAIAIYQASVDVGVIHSAMLPGQSGGNYLALNRSDVNSKLGVAEDPHKGNMSMRSNVIIDKVLTPYFYYETLQHNGCMLIAENAHIAGQPAQAVQNAYNTILTNINYIKLQRGLLPQYLLSDDVVVDLDAGLMWYAVLQPEAKYGDASQRAADFTYSAGYSTTWDDWRLPTDSEMRVLRDRGRLIAVTSSVNQRDSSVAHDGSNASQGNYGYSAQGLPVFGFRGLSALNSDGECWCDDWTYRVGDTGRNYWDKTSNEEFRLNHQDNDTYNLTALNTSKRPYFLVRTISVNGSPPLVANDTFLGPSDPNNQPPALFGRDCTNAEYLTMGALDHFNFVDVYDPDPREGDYVDDSLNNTVDVNGAFQIVLGGSVTLGTGVTTSYSFTTASYSENAYQEQNPSNVPLRMHGITAYWGGNSSSVDNPDHSKVDVTPDAEIDWHGTGSQQSAPITAQAYSTSGTLVTKSSTVTAVNSTTPFLKSISMFPRNRKYDTAGLASGSTTAFEDYSCVAYWSDRRVVDVTSQAKWGIYKNDGQDPPVTPSTYARFGPTILNRLTWSKAINGLETVNVTCSYGGKDDSTLSKIFDQ